MDGHGRALSFTLSPGQAQELLCVYAVPDDLPRPSAYIGCDRGHAPHMFRADLSGAGDLVLSSRRGKMFLQSPVPNGPTGIGFWLKTYMQDSRNGGLLPHATKRQLRPSSSSFPLLPGQATSRPNRPWKTNAFGYRLFYKGNVPGSFLQKTSPGQFHQGKITSPPCQAPHEPCKSGQRR